MSELLKTGWKPERTIVFGSWDAEEEGLIGSTEWGEQHEKDLASAAAYFNLDVAVSGGDLGASAVPSLKGFMRDVTRFVPSPKAACSITCGETRRPNSRNAARRTLIRVAIPMQKWKMMYRSATWAADQYHSVFIQHLGIPSTDMTSSGPYGVYHSAFDNFNWFKKFGDPTFVYQQEMARVLGLEALHMAAADVLPYDYELYGREISDPTWIRSQDKAKQMLGADAHRLQQSQICLPSALYRGGRQGDWPSKEPTRRTRPG